VTSYSYSSRGELLNVTLPDGKLIEYVHDPLGRRIAKKVDGSITEKYLWQGLTRLLAVYDGTDNLMMRFEYADGRMPVAMDKGGITYYLTYDQVGSLRVVADASGNVVKRIDYDSFGNIINDTNPSFEIPFGFAGGLQDRDTELVRFGFRDYDPDIGKWTAKDPIGFLGRDVDLYGYVLNDPINKTDPLGLRNDSACGNACNQDWVDCYTNCINTLVPFDALKSFVSSNIVANAGYYLSGGVTSITMGGETIVLIESPLVLTGTAGAAVAAIGEAALWVGGSIAAWVAGSSYGCMITCGIDSCSYK
jgi:RHS repeat-associated protein